jgi:cytochrome c biogenesis protein
MAKTTQKSDSLLQRLWALGCSLKLAIALASIATLLIMGGSLIMHYNPSIFGGMEQEIMGEWLPTAWRRAPLLVSWIPLSGLCVFLFAINTLCCLIDWLLKIKVRWRKTGEYLIHAGFILLTVAYLWGSISGFRSGPHRIFPGDVLPIPDMPEYSLRLEEFTPQLEPSGRPLDMINKVSLWRHDQQVAKTTIKINHPLIYDGLVILPSSFGQEMQGFRFHLPKTGFVNLTSGSRLPVSEELTLVVHKLLPDAIRNRQGMAIQRSNRLNNPAMQLALHDKTGEIWQGWYFLREPLPKMMARSQVFLRPVEPVYKTFSLLTINRDPGDKLALAGSLFITFGVFFAFFSFYRKRAQGDRPEV